MVTTFFLGLTMILLIATCFYCRWYYHRIFFRTIGLSSSYHRRRTETFYRNGTFLIKEYVLNKNAPMQPVLERAGRFFFLPFEETLMLRAHFCFVS